MSDLVAILHQGCIPTYRRAFYEQLGAIRERQYVVYHGEAEPGTGLVAAKPPFGFEHVLVKNRFISVLGRTLVYQPVYNQIAKGNYAAIVIGHEAKYITNWRLARYFRSHGRPVLLWGFGTDPWLGERSPAGRALNHITRTLQRRLLNLGTDYLAYTSKGARAIRQSSRFPTDRVTTLNNTIDISQEIFWHGLAQQLDRDKLRAEMGLPKDAIVFLFIGRLTKAKRADELIKAALALRVASNLPIEVLIVGTGPEQYNLPALAQGESWCHFLGDVFESETLASIFRVSDAVVIPGYVGLAVNHAFAHGLPVITCAGPNHSPEVDYIEEWRNGLIAHEAFFGQILHSFATTPELREKLSAGALATRDLLHLENMVAAFDSGVRRALERGKQ